MNTLHQIKGLELETLSHSIGVYSVIKAQRETATEYYIEDDLMNISTKWLVRKKSEWEDIWNLLPAKFEQQQIQTAPHFISYDG